MERQDEQLLKELLNREVVPATGCTEIGAVALAAGWAVLALAPEGETPDRIEVEVDENTYKNALGVGVPGTGESGLDFAAAMGALSSGKVEKGLQILESPDPATVKRAKVMLSERRVEVVRISGAGELLVRAKAHSKSNHASALIQGSHDHLVGVEKNGKPYHGAPISGKDFWKQTEEIKKVSYRSFVEFVRKIDLEEFPILKQALEMNMRFAAEAQKESSLLRIGQAMKKYGDRVDSGEGLSGRIQFLTALAVEARMKGLDLPVMACAGSGNQGLVATLPVVETAKRLLLSEDQTLRALALSYLTTIYIKAFTGLLSPICGCGVAAAVGSGCGIVFLLGGETSQIEAQINNMVGAMAGIICDGAKSGCSMKALMAVGLAIDSSYLSMENVQIPAQDGIMGKDVMNTLKNLQEVIQGGMASMDATIVGVMEAKQLKQPPQED